MLRLAKKIDHMLLEDRNRNPKCKVGCVTQKHDLFIISDFSPLGDVYEQGRHTRSVDFKGGLRFRARKQYRIWHLTPINPIESDWKPSTETSSESARNPVYFYQPISDQVLDVGQPVICIHFASDVRPQA